MRLSPGQPNCERASASAPIKARNFASALGGIPRHASDDPVPRARPERSTLARADGTGPTFRLKPSRINKEWRTGIALALQPQGSASVSLIGCHGFHPAAIARVIGSQKNARWMPQYERRARPATIAPFVMSGHRGLSGRKKGMAGRQLNRVNLSTVLGCGADSPPDLRSLCSICDSTILVPLKTWPGRARPRAKPEGRANQG